MMPKYFLVCTEETIKKIFDDGWTDIIRGAKINELALFDKDKEEDWTFYQILRIKMEKERIER